MIKALSKEEYNTTTESGTVEVQVRAVGKSCK